MIILSWALVFSIAPEKVRFLLQIIIIVPIVTLVIVVSMQWLAAAVIKYISPDAKLLLELPRLMLYSYLEVRDETGDNS